MRYCRRAKAKWTIGRWRSQSWSNLPIRGVVPGTRSFAVQPLAIFDRGARQNSREAWNSRRGADDTNGFVGYGAHRAISPGCPAALPASAPPANCTHSAPVG
jgi:hypothetical protein